MDFGFSGMHSRICKITISRNDGAEEQNKLA